MSGAAGFEYRCGMQDVIGLTVYNPSSLTDESFLRGFVARQDLAKDLIGRLAEVAAGNLHTHFLVLGQRGMGKTSMLRRLALAAKTDPRLSSSLIPLSFREEQYNVHSSQVFWTNCLDALGDWFDEIGDHVKAAQLDKDIAALTSKHEDALALFNRWIKGQNRRPLLLLDNIDLIFEGLKKEPDYHEKFMPAAGGMVVVGGSATYIDLICEKKGALHDSFNVVKLDRLSKSELITCLRSLALARGEEGEKVLRVLANESARIKTLHDLTGGNPRTLTMLYLLLEDKTESDVFGDLERLLDQATVLYKARVEDLPPQSRVVLDAVALAWDPTLASNVAAATLLDVNTVSSQLDRLHREGIIERVPVSKSTRTAYQISERFFNIWYLMRHGARRQRTRLRWLTVFLKSFYSTAQLIERAKSLVSLNGELGIKLGDDVSVETGQYLLALSEAIDDEGWRSVLTSDARGEFERYALARGKTLQDIVDPSDVPLPANAVEWVTHGNLLRQHLKRPKDAEAAFKKAIELAPSSWAAWFNLGTTKLADLADPVGAIEALKESLRLNPRHLFTQYVLGDALKEAGETEAAIAAYRACLKLSNKFYLAEIALGDIYSQEANLKAAAEHYRQAARLAPTRDTEALHASGFFAAYILEEFDRALNIYRRLLEINPKDDIAKINQVILLSLINRTQSLDLDQGLLQKHPESARALIKALHAISRDDLGAALSFIPSIFDDDTQQIFESYKGFVLVLFREAHRNGWGDLLIRILDETGASEKNWPLRVGYEAYMYGTERLLDVNPEVRSAASKIQSLLAAPDIYEKETEPPRIAN